MGIENLLTYAKNSIITIEYCIAEKILVTPCTLNSAIYNVLSAKPIPNKLITEYSICVWAIDIADWKYIKIDTIINWYIGHPKCESR